MKLRNRRTGKAIPVWTGCLFSGWMTAAAAEYLLLPVELRELGDTAFLGEMSVFRVGSITCVCAVLFFILSGRGRRPGVFRWTAAAAFGLLMGASLLSVFSWGFLGVSCLVLGVLISWGIFGWNSSCEATGKKRPASKSQVVLTVVFAVLIFLLISAWTVGRVYCYNAPTYDFGIFSQMFYNMKTSGLPLTTLERDGLLSHFKVHMSPVYYLLLPVYCLFPTPATLQVLQAAVITSSVIPLWKLGEIKGLSGGQRMLLCVLFLMLPGFSGGVGYDFHENCFLAPLLLWLFYALERKTTVLVVFVSFLTLGVKEDAAVYTAVIGLWLTARSLLCYQRTELWHLLTGIGLIGGSVVYFWVVTGYLVRFGDGVMTYRYANFMHDGVSLAEVVRAVLVSPGKLLYECTDPEKLSYIALTLLPLMGLPLWTQRFERFILLIPYILINLMSDYVYQHDLFFQYNFGSTAFLIYLTAVNLADIKWGKAKTAALLAAGVVSAVCFGWIIVPQAVKYPAQCGRYAEYYSQIREALDEIPEEVSVTASTFYTTQLSQREIIYDVGYASREHLMSTDYIVLDLSADYKKWEAGNPGGGLENLRELLVDAGYSMHSELSGVLVIYHRQNTE